MKITDARSIKLTQGYETVVDAADFDELNQYKWYAYVRPNRPAYAVRMSRALDGRRIEIRMHRFLLPGVEVVDHRDGDGLNNRRSNLRPATSVENQRNRGKSRTNTSGFLGVSWHKASRRWHARIQAAPGETLSLGYFVDLVEAARARDAAALVYYGEFAVLNFPQPGVRSI
jgi:hypothetical protein